MIRSTRIHFDLKRKILVVELEEAARKNFEDSRSNNFSKN